MSRLSDHVWTPETGVVEFAGHGFVQLQDIESVEGQCFTLLLDLDGAECLAKQLLAAADQARPALLAAREITARVNEARKEIEREVLAKYGLLAPEKT